MVGADVDGGVEGTGDFWVHVDEQILFGGQVIVALLDARLDPIVEGLPNDGEVDVDQPLPVNLVHVPILRQVLGDSAVLSALLDDALDGEGAVAGHLQHLDVRILDV